MRAKSIEWYRKKYFAKDVKKKPTKKPGTKRASKKPSSLWDIKIPKVRI